MPDFLTQNKVAEILGGVSDPAQQDSVFNELVNQGFEIENYNATFNFGEAVGNFPGDVVEIGKQIWQSVSNLPETVNSLSSLGRGAMRKLTENITGEQLPEQGAGRGFSSEQDEELFSQVIDIFHEQYGGWDRLLNTIEKKPAQFLSDLSILLNPASGALRATLAGTRFSKAAQATNRLVRMLEPTTALREGAGVVVGTLKSPLKHSFTRMIGATDATLENLAKGTRTFPADPTDWLIKHGISPTNGLKKMSERLGKITDLTRTKLDDVLAIVPDRFKHADTQALLNRIKKYYSKEKVDVVEGIDIVDKKGIPYKHKEPIFIPEDDLPESILERIKKIKELSNKAPDGLTLSEMNEIKRLSDNMFDVYSKSAEVKGGALSDKVGKLRKSTRKFIEDKADEMAVTYGDDLKNVAEFNQQIQYAKGWKDVAEKTRLVGTKRHGIAESILGVGALTSALYGDLSKSVAFIGAIGALELSRLPRIKSFILTKLGLMGTTEYARLLGNIKHFSKTQEVGQVLRKLRRELMRYARHSGLIGEQKLQQIEPFSDPEKQVLPQFQTTEQDVLKQ